MSVLERIVEKKRERLKLLKGRVPLSEIRSMSLDTERPRDFRNAIKRGAGGIRLIAEIKRASPSKGVIREDFDPEGIAAIYEEKAVDAISVLTEEDFFKGHLQDLAAVKKIVTRPVLRKDFIFDEYQIYESRAYGADAILLIASLLDRVQAEEYLHCSSELQLSVLFEVHSPEELERALYLDAGIIGINNRDLNTLTVDLNRTLMLKREIPPDRVVVSESGIKTRGDVLRLEAAGIDAILVGTAFIESNDIGKKIDELMGSEGEQK
jgi:indole-3-glycerol phosphate synthase